MRAELRRLERKAAWVETIERAFQKWRERTAYHEAGHAVVGYCHSRSTLRALHLSTTGQPDSYTRVDAPDEDQIAIAFGGIFAESRFTGRELTIYDAPGDCTALAEYLAKAPWVDVESKRQCARTIVSTRWALVEALARELLAEGDLTGAQARQILADVEVEP